MTVPLKKVREQIESDKLLALEARATVDKTIDDEEPLLLPDGGKICDKPGDFVSEFLDYKIGRMWTLKEVRGNLFFARVDVEVPPSGPEPDKEVFLVSKTRLIGAVSVGN